MINYEKKVLDNGLTLLISKDEASSMVAVNLIYKVGAKNEDEERTGFAHLFEHLMFGGSINVPDYDTPVQLAMGENNAFTNNDYTDYYVVLPKENLETALWIESDRMRLLDINERSLEVQKKVVIEEFKQRYLNKPYGDVWQLLRELSYTKHPYRWATIGRDVSHIEGATLDDVRAFYDKYYTPSNVILSIVGDITMEGVLPLVEKWFGDIEGRVVIPKQLPTEPEPIEARRLEVEREVPITAIYITFLMENRMSEQFAVCDTISDILSNGESSRLLQNLVRKKQILTSANAYLTGDIEQGLFVVTGHLSDGVTIEEAEVALWQELESMKSELISVEELQKVKNKFEVNTIFGELNIMNKAMNLGYYDMIGDIDYVNRELEIYKGVTPEKIASTAEKLFRPERSSTLIYKAKDGK